MRFRPGFVVLLLAIYAISTFTHWVTWKWLRRVAPRWTGRYRRPVLGLVAVLFALPMTQQMAAVLPTFPWQKLAGAGLVWHLTVWLGTLGLALLRLPGWVQHTFAPRRHESPAASDRREALEKIGGAFAFAASGAVFGWGTFRGRYEWAIEEVAIRLARLPKALDGFTIVQISDLHVGTFIGERELAMGLGLVRGVRADLIVITGDIVDSDPGYVALAARHLGNLRAREGIVCIPGNHDYYTGAHAVLEGMREVGIDVLLNRGKVLAAPDGGGFALLGVDDFWARERYGAQGPDVARAQSMVRPDLATILLAHQPRFASTAAEAGVDLQLSGHTHGGQINLGLRPIDLFSRYVAGRYQVGSMQLYVNRGFGTVGPPTRVGAPPEITKIVLVAG